MAILNRLPTRDRLLGFGLEVEGDCVLCESNSETRGHIFFQCEYSKLVWQSLLQACQIHRVVMDWNRELEWASAMRGRSFDSMTFRLIWNCFVYSIWRERNCRIFSGAHCTGQDLIVHVKEIVKLKLLSMLHNGNRTINMDFCIAWGIDV
ncbi:hypothetical protein V6N11_032146 [Hibiscus sabdariffa]|uniref:Reverse transcriptase zinc-binding domain-containing protein n=1 Tax=Hibiscus sabdariffa TaxID=183260 RepID=A0ABR2SZS4_9ROSI